MSEEKLNEYVEAIKKESMRKGYTYGYEEGYATGYDEALEKMQTWFMDMISNFKEGGFILQTAVTKKSEESEEIPEEKPAKVLASVKKRGRKSQSVPNETGGPTRPEISLEDADRLEKAYEEMAKRSSPEDVNWG